MKNIQIGNTDIYASQVALGCMRMADLSSNQATKVIEMSVEAGINFFDHAEIYGHGKSEELFCQALKASSIRREDLILQSKFGILETHYDSSATNIYKSLEGILQRLGTDYLDILLIHRPDPLMEVEEVAEAFNSLQKQGKVRYFGVSNHNSSQIALLNQYLTTPIQVNQIQFGPGHTLPIDSGLYVNTRFDQAVNRDGYSIEESQLQNVRLQAWSPLKSSLSKGLLKDDPEHIQMVNTIQDLADQYQVSFEAMVLAWILRHPIAFQPIIGSMNPIRIKAMVEGSLIHLSRKEWYDIYSSRQDYPMQ